MRRIRDAENRVIYRDEHAYCAHPHIARLNRGEWVAVFNNSVRRSIILHPPHDPRYYNMIIRSSDGGQTWCSPRVAPGYDWYGVECAGLTLLADDTLLLNQWRFKWYPLETALALDEAGVSTAADWLATMNHSEGEGHYYGLSLRPQHPTELAPWGRANGGTYIHRSPDGGRTWDETVLVDTSPYSGGYGMRGGIQLSSGDILMPFSDVPHYRTVFVVRSEDGGHTWGKPVEVASQPDREFEEPCALDLGEGYILMIMRENKTSYLHQCVSRDNGFSWSSPEPTPILGYPGHLLALPDGRILCVYGYRFEPYAIRAVLSHDQGRTWDVDNIYVVRDGLPSADLGYPSSVLADNGRIFTIYYAQDSLGVTHIQSTNYSL